MVDFRFSSKYSLYAMYYTHGIMLSVIFQHKLPQFNFIRAFIRMKRTIKVDRVESALRWPCRICEHRMCWDIDVRFVLRSESAFEPPGNGVYLL